MSKIRKIVAVDHIPEPHQEEAPCDIDIEEQQYIDDIQQATADYICALLGNPYAIEDLGIDSDTLESIIETFTMVLDEYGIYAEYVYEQEACGDDVP